VEEGDDGAFALSATASVDGGGREGLPHNGLADVNGNEKGDAGAKAVALLEKFVEDDDNDTSAEELEDDEDGVASAKLVEVTVHARSDVSHGLADNDDDAEELLGALEEGTVFLEALVDFDDLGTSEKLHNHARSHDRTNAKLH